MAGRSAITHDDGAGKEFPEIVWRRNDGLVPYPDAMAAMQQQIQAIRAGIAPQQVWLLEHPPVFTAGTSARAEDLFNPLGFETFEAGRGGQWTYHGPGQRIAYVMLDLQQRHGAVPDRDVRCFVHGLEGWLIAALSELGVEAGRRDGRVGVWVRDHATGRDNKIAALGVRITRWVSWHGISVNVSPDLRHFDGIVPCGIREHGATSLEALGRDASMTALDEALAACWPRFFGGNAPVIQAA
ncbi:lipoyl(octanoyl) transferase LipB [Acetobacteraceae bacterium KSS8]|uniref:Octanoyltransferase n=1 Tax=Endosaccharibacter trunci TaxID=2812733 RepID=A0ABT1W4L7_9PROT|nr:lipoyl(octanoyl) transferase LipB [Acetobacteraceae bacterium KSS8]